MFDCVLPTRSGRTGLAFTWQGKLNLKKGVSVTDGCVGIKETERLLLSAHKQLQFYKQFIKY